MEDLSEAFGLNQRASALDPETVSETDVPQVLGGANNYEMIVNLGELYQMNCAFRRFAAAAPLRAVPEPCVDT